MKIVYNTSVTASGGRNGRAESADGLLGVDLSIPDTMGGPGRDATNPEQLFGAGYAACFENAILHVAEKEGHKIERSSVTARVGMGVNEDESFGLEVELDIDIEGLDGKTAEGVVKEADRLCPYSNAIRGNVPVNIKIV